MSLETQVIIDTKGGEVRKTGIDQSAFFRLTREMWMLRCLQRSPNVPQLISSSAIAHTLTTEYVAGRSFTEVFSVDAEWNAQAKSWEEAAPYLAQYVAAEEDLLKRGFLYRDLSLDHLIFTGDKAVLVDHEETVIDMEEGSKDWYYSSVRGTWETMAPEEFRGYGHLTERTATYRSAVLAHVALSGHLPFPRFPYRSDVHHWRKTHAPQVSSALPSLTRRVLRTALDLKPPRRYASPAPFFKALTASYEDTV